jgi:hypothetical protein
VERAQRTTEISLARTTRIRRTSTSRQLAVYLPLTESSINRKLDDSELDSGDEEGRTDRLAHTVEDEDLIEEKQIAEAQSDLAPIRPPEGDEVRDHSIPSTSY